MLKIITLFIDGGRIRSGHRFYIIDTERPLFSWSVSSDADDNAQTACRVMVKSDKILWDSGYLNRSEQSLRYGGERLPHGVPLTVEISVKDRYGRESEGFVRRFVSGKLDSDELRGSWIKHPNESAESERAYRFRRDFVLEDLPVSVCLYCSGIGYQLVTLNGREMSDARLDPAHSDYSKLVYYTVDTDFISLLSAGENTLGIEIAPGWRNNKIGWYDGADPAFFGETQVWAMLVLTFQDGRTEIIATDETWNVGYSAVVSASIYNGETFDARLNDPTGLLSGSTPDGFVKAVKTEAPGGVLLPMTLEPIRPTEIYKPIEITSPKKGLFVVDFGQNIAGVVRLTLPEHLECGQTLTLKFSEELHEDGNLYPDTLRSAKSTDTYIASGDFRDLDVWEPHFTYHGFRYCSVEGLDTLSKKNISAVLLGTDLKNESFFRCGSALVNEIQRCIVMTERDNMHSILTDCPQRDERLAWLNDATVRFEEMPYNFDIGRIFPKVVRDIRAQQSDGAITCCSPLYLGSQPADPVCSSYLIAVYQAWMATGDTSLIEESFDGLAAWEECLLSHSDDYIVNYSYYGDWASPVYACETEISPASGVTDRLLMSTGYSYFNCKLLAKLSTAIGREKDVCGEFHLATREEAGHAAGLSDVLSPITLVEDGDVRSVVEVLMVYESSVAVVRYTLNKMTSDVGVSVRIRFMEPDRAVKLSFLPAFSATKVIGQTIFGREELKTDGSENVSQKWLAATDGEQTFSVLNTGSYGSDFRDGELRLTLLRSAAYTAHPIGDRQILTKDRFLPRIDIGEREFHFVIKGGTTEERMMAVDREAAILNEPPYAVNFFPSGSGDEHESALSIDNAALVLSSFRRNENGYILRIFNPTETVQDVEIQIPPFAICAKERFSPYEVRTFLAKDGELEELTMDEKMRCE